MSGYPMLLILKEKYSNEYYFIKSNEELNRVAVAKIKERVEQGHFNLEDEDMNPSEKKWIEAILESDRPESLTITSRGMTKRLAFHIMLSRRGHEYEGFELKPFSTVPGEAKDLIGDVEKIEA